MKTFLQWVEENKLPLLEKPPTNKKTLDERQARSGIAHWAYPPAYVRHQYPAPYFMPTAADAMQKMGSDNKS